MIPDSFKEDLLRRVDVAEVVGRYVQLKRAGANLTGLCPFHNEKSPSFTVSPAKQFYHCFGCGAHGNAIGFLMAHSGLGYIDALKDLASSVGMQVPERDPARSAADTKRRERETDLFAVMEHAMEFYRATLKKSPRAIEYLKNRGLSGEIAARFRMGYAPDDWQGLREAFPAYDDKALVECGLVVANEDKRYDRFRDRIMFPIFNARGAVIGFGGRVIVAGGDSAAEPAPPDARGAGPKYLNSPETPLFEKGRELYGLLQARDAIRAAGRVLVVEGYMDVVALAQFGVGYAAATLGTATSAIHVTTLLRLADEIVFCFDGDAAGRKAAWRALEVALPLARDDRPMRFHFLPEGEDPDSYIRRHGREDFERDLGEAPTLSGFLISELRAQSDFRTAEGKSGFLASAKPLVRRIEAPGLRLLVLKEVAALAEVSQEEAARLLDMGAPAPVWRRSAPARAPAAAVRSLESSLLRCVLVAPVLARGLDFDLLDESQPETPVLRSIADWIEDTPGLTDAGLIERFQDDPRVEVVFRAQAAALDQNLTREGAEQEAQQISIQMQIRHVNAEFDLLKRAQSARPTAEGQAEMQRRAMELSVLRSRRS